VTLATNFASGARVTGYPAELRQVFINLFANAADASAPGSLIELRTEVCAERRRNSSTPDLEPRPAGVLVSITDHGEGIAADTLPKLFHPFFTTKGEQGTGLGLWVSQGIVQKHGGSISIESSTDAEAHGTTVTVFLPRGEAVPS